MNKCVCLIERMNENIYKIIIKQFLVRKPNIILPTFMYHHTIRLLIWPPHITNFVRDAVYGFKHSQFHNSGEFLLISWLKIYYFQKSRHW